MTSASPGPPRTPRRERKRLAEERRPLRATQRYRALGDVIDDGFHLWKNADNKARTVVTLLGPLIGVLLILLANPEMFDALPPPARVPFAVAVVAVAVVAVGLFMLAIRALQPYEVPATAEGLPDDPEAALGLRALDDVANWPLGAYRDTWGTARMSHLQSEMAAQAHAIAFVNHKKFAALERLYRALQGITLGAVLLGGIGTGLAMIGPPEEIHLRHGVKLHVGRPQGARPGQAVGGSSTGLAAVERGRRDWTRFPAIVSIDTPDEIVALGDVHGGYDRLVALLQADGLVRPDARAPGGYAWSGGKRVLVSVGDLIDKGGQSLPVLDLMMGLEEEAPASGGRVVVTMGNHEAEFLAKPGKRKVAEFDAELAARGIDARAVAEGRIAYGAWIRERPLAARVNSWFFAHAGRTAGLGVDALSARFRQVVDGEAWKSKFLVGDDSILEARLWWKQEDVGRDLAALGLAHIVFGHDPGAFAPKGVIVARQGGQLFRIDVGMSPAIDDSPGALLVVDRKGDIDVATTVDPAGARREIWRGPAHPSP